MKKCFFCKSDIPKGEKNCPNCGRKSISRNWLILIIVVAVIILVGIFSDTDRDSSDKSDFKSQSYHYRKKENSKNIYIEWACHYQ